MGVITPNGEMFLLHVNIDPANQLWFESKTTQESFFKSRSVVGLSPTDYTFIQKDNYVRVHKNADQLYNANYLMYRNTAHSDRWFYAYIKDITWLSDSSSAIKFETDVYQTWRFDISFMDSLIERETVSNDVVGNHMLHEGLELGDYTIAKEVSSGLGELAVAVATTVQNVKQSVDTTGGNIFNPVVKTPMRGNRINGIYSGAGILWFDNTFPSTNPGDDNHPGKTVKDLNAWIEHITALGAEEAIMAIYMCPRKVLDTPQSTTIPLEGYEIDGVDPIPVGSAYYLGGSAKSTGFTVETGLTTPTDFRSDGDVVVPRNKKLLTPPYTTMYAHNGNGSGAEFDYTEFTNMTPKFKVIGSVLPMPQFKLIPLNYKGINTEEGNLDEALTIQNYPMCNYNIDQYKAWLAQNGTSTAIGVAGGVGAAGASVALAGSAIATGGLAGAGLAGVMAISSVTNAAQSYAQMKEVEIKPPHSQGSANTGSSNSTIQANDFFVGYKQIRAEFARAIDKYFSMYGYKVNRVGRPHFNCRERFYYCKLINPNIYGAIPVPDLGKIKEMFMNGVTLWNSHSEIGNYYKDNKTKTTYSPPDPTNPSPT